MRHVVLVEMFVGEDGGKGQGDIFVFDVGKGNSLADRFEGATEENAVNEIIRISRAEGTFV